MSLRIALASSLVLLATATAASAQPGARRKFDCENHRRSSMCVEGVSIDGAKATEYHRGQPPLDRLFAPPPGKSGPSPEGNGASAGGSGGGGGGGGGK